MATHAHSDIEMEPLVADSSSSPNNTSKSSQTIVSTLLGYRQIAANAAMRNRNAIYAAQVAVFICYLCVVFLSHGMDASDSKEHGLLKRIVKNGIKCDHQRPQINVFMAAFFGSFAAADQLYARNWALAVPKIIVLLPSTLLGISLIVLGFSLLFVWTIVDSVLWGIGFYTTDAHWGNPTRSCAVEGW